MDDASSTSTGWCFGSSSRFYSTHATSGNAFIYLSVLKPFNINWCKPWDFQSVSIIIVVVILQFRPLVPAPQQQQFMPVAPQHFQPVGQNVPLLNAAMSSQTPQPQFPPLMQQLPARPGPSAPSHLPTPQQVISFPNSQPVHITAGASLPQPNAQAPSLYPPGSAALGRPLSDHIL